jgi:hypothetical protein
MARFKRYGKIEVAEEYAAFEPDLVESVAEEGGVSKESVRVIPIPCSLCGKLMLAAFVADEKRGDIPVPEKSWRYAKT